MKKIGILTFHRATNYGAILQAYALEAYLNSIGFDAMMVDHRPEEMGILYAPINVPTFYKKFKRIVLNILMLPSLKERKSKRDMFWNYTEKTLHLSEPMIKGGDLPVLDAYIVGSDQVWSTCFTGGIDKYYWGQFDHKGAKMISYAGSAAEDMKGSFYDTDNASLLNSFDSISVREDELKEFLETQLPNKKIIKVLDPTLMAGVEYFDQLIKDEKPMPQPYILVYQVIRTKDNEIQEYAKQVASKLHCDIIEIKNSRLHIYHEGKLAISDQLVNPTQFVSMYKHAQYIITTSFHGTAFSLLFNRLFDVVSVSPEVDSRAKDVLTQIGLERRMIQLPNNTVDNQLNWHDINTRLEELRKPSRDFLRDALI